MKKIIFYTSLALNLIFIASASFYIFMEIRSWSPEKMAEHRRYQDQIDRHIKLIEKSLGSPLSYEQKMVVNRILDNSKPPYKLPQGLCDGVYNPTQGERNVSSDKK